MPPKVFDFDNEEKKAIVTNAIRLYYDLVDNNYRPSPKSINAMLNNEALFTTYAEAQELENSRASRRKAFQDSGLSRGGFDILLEMEFKPVIDGSSDAEKNKAANQALLSKFAPGPEREANEKAVVQKWWNALVKYNITFSPNFLEKVPDNKYQAYDTQFLIANFAVVMDLMKKYNLPIPPKEEELVREKGERYASLIQSRNTYVRSMANCYFNFLPERNFRGNLKQCTAIFPQVSNLKPSDPTNNTVKLRDESSRFAESANQYILDQIYLASKNTTAHRQLGLEIAIKSYMNGTAFMGLCCTGDGKPVDFKTAYDAFVEKGTPFIITHTKEYVDSGMDGRCFRIVAGKDGVKTEEIPPKKWPAVITAARNPAPPKPEPVKAPEKPVKPATSVKMLDPEKDYLDTDCKDAKTTRSTMLGTIKAFNKQFSGTPPILLDKVKIDEASRDVKQQNSRVLSQELFQRLEKLPEAPEHLKEFGIRELAAFIPPDVQKQSAEMVVKYLLTTLASVNVTWLTELKPGDDFTLIWNMRKEHDGLRFLMESDKILNAAEKLNIEIPPEIRNKIDTCRTLVTPHFQIAMERLKLLAVDEYTFMPGFDTVFSDEKVIDSMLEQLEQQKKPGKEEPVGLKTLQQYKKYHETVTRNEKKLLLRNQLLLSGALNGGNGAGVEYYIYDMDSPKVNGRRQKKKVSLDKALEYLEDGVRVALFLRGSRIGSLFQYFPGSEQGVLSKDVAWYEVLRKSDMTQEDLKNRLKDEKLYNQFLVNESRMDAAEKLLSDMKKAFPNSKKWQSAKLTDFSIALDEEQYRQFDNARNSKTKIDNCSALSIWFDNQPLSNFPWIFPQVFTPITPNPNHGPGIDELNKTVTAYNKQVFDDFQLNEEQQEKLKERIKNVPTKEVDAVKFKFRYEVFDKNPIEKLKNPGKIRSHLERLVKDVVKACDLSWFDQAVNDDTLAMDWGEKRPLLKLALQEDFLRQIEKFGVEITQEQRNVINSTRFLMNKTVQLYDIRLEKLQRGLADIPKKMNITAEEYKTGMAELQKNLPEDQAPASKYSGISYSFDSDVRKKTTEALTQYQHERDYISYLRNTLQCFSPASPDLSNGKKFYNAEGVQLSPHDAFARMRQSSEMEGAARKLAGNIVYVVDPVNKTCIRHELGDKPYTFKHTEANYEEFNQKILYQETRRTSFTENEKLAEDSLDISKHIRDLTAIKNDINSTDFRPFVWNHKQITDLRRQLDVVINCYKELKPIPLDRDIKRLKTELTNLQNFAHVYTVYKEADTKINTPEIGGYEGYVKSKRTDILSWREDIRLRSSTKLTDMITHELLPNAVQDVMQNGLYHQQQRMLNAKNIDANDKKIAVRALFDKSLADLRKKRENRLEINRIQFEKYGYNADAIENGSLELRGLDAVDELLILAYEFDPRAKNISYSEETQKKIYGALATIITTLGINKEISSPSWRDKDFSGYDRSDELFSKDIPKFADSEGLKKLLPVTAMNPMNIIKLANQYATLHEKYKELNGRNPNCVIREIQVKRGAINHSDHRQVLLHYEEHPDLHENKDIKQDTNLKTITLDSFLK